MRCLQNDLCMCFSRGWQLGTFLCRVEASYIEVTAAAGEQWWPPARGRPAAAATATATPLARSLVVENEMEEEEEEKEAE